MTHPVPTDAGAPPAASEAASESEPQVVSVAQPQAQALPPPVDPGPPALDTASPVDVVAPPAEAADAAAAAAPPASGKKKPPPRASLQPVLEQLAAFYPQLFGAVFRPLKRGIFQDLLAAHPQAFERDGLKDALGFHTRSTRYLTAVASGQQRHDLQGQPVEAMAPEHVHHALLEVFRRRQGRAGEDLRPRLRERIVQACEASGLSREDYVNLVRSRDEAANALLDEAMAILAERSAKDEALLRAFESSGVAVEAFAEMYGLDPKAAARSLERARRLRPA